jgi:chaperone BCS1
MMMETHLHHIPFPKWLDSIPSEARKYKRYLLSDAKNFDPLFFPEKSQLLKLVDDFMHARGKFAIPGFPNKLGILLDGPPGTGKTSLIKALAIYLKRHIVSVSLEKVKTNQASWAEKNMFS